MSEPFTVVKKFAPLVRSRQAQYYADFQNSAIYTQLWKTLHYLCEGDRPKYTTAKYYLEQFTVVEKFSLEYEIVKPKDKKPNHRCKKIHTPTTCMTVDLYTNRKRNNAHHDNQNDYFGLKQQIKWDIGNYLFMYYIKHFILLIIKFSIEISHLTFYHISHSIILAKHILLYLSICICIFVE